MYYVYIARIGEEIVYIGKGSGKRFEHVNSGTSHNYYLNKAHFEGVVMDVQVAEEFELEKDALAREAQLIEEHKPRWNDIVHPTRRARTESRGGAGVQFMRGKYRAYKHINGKKVHIGYFLTEEEAREARSTY
jgi:predicted GIY-YIG superfamily endonuclease